MTLDQGAAIASIIASVAVVLTLIFIAIQMRQNLQLTKMSAAQSAALLLSQNYGRIIEHADLADILARVARGEEVDGTTNFAAAQFRYFELLHAHMRTGIFDDDLWAGTEGRLHEVLDHPKIREWWGDNRFSYAPSFVKLVDEIYRVEAIKDGDDPTIK